MGVVEVRQGGDVAVIVRPLQRVASIDWDAIGCVDELRQAVSRAAIQVVAGVVRRSPAQRGVGEGGGDKGWRKEKEK